MAHLKYPKKQSISFSNRLLELYGEAINCDEEEVIFDLSNTVSLSPFGVLMVSVTILECLRLNKICRYTKPENKNLQKILRESGFNNLFRLGEQTIPKDLITAGRIQLKKLNGIDPLFLETFIQILDYHLTISKGLRWSLKMSMSEATQNVVQHSGDTGYYVCARLYPREHQLRICIADMGQGILNSLKTASIHKHLTDHYEAIEYATQKGVTSKPRHAGLGLHHIKGFLAANCGQLCIISGAGKVFWQFDRGETTKPVNKPMNHFFSGTILKLVINTSKRYRYSLASEEEPIF